VELARVTKFGACLWFGMMKLTAKLSGRQTTLCMTKFGA